MAEPYGHQTLQPWTEGATDLPNGQRVVKLDIGRSGDERATVAFIAQWPPGCRVDPHTHESDYCEIIMAGSQKVGARWFHAGDVRMARAGETYGPLVAGEDGCTIVIVFDGQGWAPIVARDTMTEGLEPDTLRSLFTGAGE